MQLFNSWSIAFVVTLAVQVLCADAVQQGRSASSNPVRKVIGMLEAMKVKVGEEGEKEKELFKKFQLYCQNADEGLGKNIAEAEAKIPQLSNSIEATQGEKSQLEEDLKRVSADAAAAKAAIEEATAIRDKEAATFAAQEAEDKQNIRALTKARVAIAKGRGGSFVQTKIASVLRRLVLAKPDMDDDDRQSVLAFLSGKEDEAPASTDEISGILKTLADQISKNLKEATAAERESVSQYEELMTAKEKQFKFLTTEVETKTQRAGEVAVKLSQLANDLTDTREQLKEDRKLLADLDTTCATRKKEFEANKKIRSDELQAISETIKTLNDDKALDLFKKTLPSEGGSLLQVKVNTRMMRERALAAIEDGLQAANKASPQLDFIVLALRGKKIGFEKVLKMIDEMMATLKMQQDDDETKKEYCNSEFDAAEDKKKGLERKVGDAQTAIEDVKESLNILQEEVSKLEQGIKDLDKSVEEATAQRKDEETAYQTLMASNTAAKDLLRFAKNRLNKFYNPKLYVPPPKSEGSPALFLQVRLGMNAMDQEGAIPPPPETAGAYTANTDDSTGVIQMIDMLIADLDKELAAAEATEKEAQKDYETTIADSKEKRKLDSQTLTEKKSAIAGTESEMEKREEVEESHSKELSVVNDFIKSLHGECDWLVRYFDIRKEARANELDALEKGKAILNGADFAFL